MQAYIFNEKGKFELVEKKCPNAAKGGAVIKICAASICGTDFRTYLHGSSKIATGITIGHEMCGEIVEIDRQVRGFAKGDRVAVAPALGCGSCYMCQKGHANMCDHLETLGFAYDGSFAEYMEIPARFFEMGNVNHVPENVSEEAAALAEPIACVVNAQEFLNIGKGDYVAVFGSGFIGCMHAELAFASGAEKVFMLEPNDARAQAAQEFAPRVEMVGLEDAQREVLERTDGRGVDVAIVACSVGEAQRQAQQMMAKRGRMSLFGGLPGEGTGYLDSNVIHYKELGIYGVHASTAAQNRKVLEWMKEGRINAEKYIAARYPLEKIGEAFEDIRTRGIMKAVITV